MVRKLNAVFNSFYRRRGKRCFDLLVTLVCIVILLLFMLFIAAAVYFVLGSPVIFFQKRPGVNGKVFTLIKFRTMTEDRNKEGKLFEDAKRLGMFGRLLRCMSLDELLTFFNVLKGDMSLVGPRPLLVEYLDRYTSDQARRHEVRPGITGWAQVNGRNVIRWEEKFKLDIWYVDHQSFWLDIKIVALTIWKILKREGINQPGQATMEEFRG